MIMGIFDWTVLMILILLNFTYLRRSKLNIISGIVYVLLILIVLPFISQYLEIHRVKNTTGIIDNFEIWYTYSKYPIYWGIGIVQIYVIAFKDYKKYPTINDR